MTGDSQPADHPADRPVAGAKPPSWVVGIGASAGGLPALEELLAHLPADTGMAFVIVTHLHRDQPTILPELLADRTAMRVAVVTDATALEPDCIYLAPPGTLLTLEDSLLRSENPDGSGRLYHPIDHFFRSLADDQQERSIAVVLSGSGRDGALGIVEVKGASGVVMAQEPDSAHFDSMPRSAISRGLVDHVLVPARLAAELTRYSREPPSSGRLPDELDAAVHRIVRKLHERTGHSFASYKRGTLTRRVQRRMHVNQLADPAQYLAVIQENPHELDALFRELLISVTSFFRDPAAFTALADVLRTKIAMRSDPQPFRVWVTGCATGEEAYSIAMLLHELYAEQTRPLDAQIFATDLDAHAIEIARAGVYLSGIAADLTPSRLERFFTREDGLLRVSRELREKVVFAVQNLTRDPPFTKLDLVSCRNLLIYLKAEEQGRLVPLFHYALAPGGLLFVGPSEGLGRSADLFEPLDKRWKLFRRRDRGVQAPPLPIPDRDRFLHGPPHLDTRPGAVTLKAEHALMLRFAPPSVLVNERGELRFIHGRTGRYLEPASGEPTHNLFTMARHGLRLELPSIVAAALGGDAEVWRRGVAVQLNGDILTVDLCASQVREPESLRGLVLVSFFEAEPQPPVEVAGPGADRIRDLELDLHNAREHLQKNVEELATANEELKSANEELQSTNEELLSMNEELETSKEEMQSLNEELMAVNNELEEKLSELAHAHGDMKNLLDSTDVATLFLDNELRIKRFTPQARAVVNLIETDVGRPLRDMAANLDYQDLTKDAREVLDTLVPKEREVRILDGGESWALMRILPYRTTDNVVEGLVITFVEVTRLKAAEEQQRRLGRVFQHSLDPMLLIALDGAISELNHAAMNLFDVSRAALLGSPLTRWVRPQEGIDAEALLARCRNGEAITDVSALYEKPDRSVVPLELSLVLIDDTDSSEIIVTARRALRNGANR